MKKSLKRWHLLGAVMALSMAFAMPVFAEPAETVKVTVPNVKGGYLEVSYENEDGQRFRLPIGETVSVPKGSELRIRANGITYRPTSDKRVEASLKSLMANDEDLVEANGRNYNITADEDLKLTAVFTGEERSIKTEGEEYMVLFQSTEEETTGVLTEGAWSDKLYLENLTTGKKIDFSNVSVDVSQVYYEFTGEDGYPDQEDLEPDFFNIDKNGVVTASEKLQKGRYIIQGDFEYQEDLDAFYLEINVGARADFRMVTCMYKYSKNGWSMRSEYLGEVPVSDPANTTLKSVADSFQNSPDMIQLAGHPVSGWGSYRASTNSFTKYNLVDKVSKYLEAHDVVLTLTMIPQNYKVPEIQWLDAADVVPEDRKPGWVQEDGKWRYWTKDQEWATNQWIGNNNKLFWVGADGVMVTDGIAGTGDDKWFVNKKGERDTGKNGTAVIDGMEYTFENGKVVAVKLYVKTPSNATEVKGLADSLLNNMDSLSDEEKVEAADKLMGGIKKLNPSSMNEEEVLKYDDIFKAVFGNAVNLAPSQDAVMGKGAPDDSDMQLGGYVLKGAYVASGITSEMIEKAGGTVDVEYRVEQIATDSNASQAVRFNVTLLVNGKEVNSLAAPVYLELEMPEVFVASYSNATYNYKGSFEKNGSKKTFTLVFQNSGEKLILTVQDTGTYAIVVTKKSSSSGGSRSGARGSKGTYTATVNKPGAWVQNQTGWWYRFTDGTWPANQWMSLSLQGTDYWFFFNADGYMVTGWQLFENNWYYLNSVSDGTQGRMLTGWQLIDGKWYYLNTVSGPVYGAMLKDTTTPDGYTVGSDGALIE